jgi:hypothetical protein
VPEPIIVPRIGPTDRIVELSPLRLCDAVTGATPKLSTAVRFASRGDFFVVRFDARHRGIVATLREDRAPLWTEDVVEIFLAFEDPPVRYLELELNPLGARFSAVVSSPHGTREGMAVVPLGIAGFATEVRVREAVWSAVFRLPWRSLPFAPKAGRFRANAFRIDRTAGEFSALFATGASPPDFHVTRAFGEFRVSAGTGLE